MSESEEHGEREGESLEQQQHALNVLCMNCDNCMHYGIS